MKQQSFADLYLGKWPYEQFDISPKASAAVSALRRERSGLLDRPYNRRWWRNAVRLAPLPEQELEIRDGFVCFDPHVALDAGGLRVLEGALHDLKSWRKGPFRYSNIEVDAEWRSDLKWNRVMELIDPEMRGRRIADIGCNNLYYIYRMLEHEPGLVVGLEPVDRYFFYYYLNEKLYSDERIQFELFGIDDLSRYGPFFDLVFCMGILYHRRHPLLSLEHMASGMRPGAQLVIETAGIRGDEELCLFPGSRYMKAPGWWFLPTVSALENMLVRTGFEEVEVRGVFPITTDEQRKTEWVDTESLDNFLDPANPEKTVEGYPAPIRIYATARRRA